MSKLAKKLLSKRLKNLRYGQLILKDATGEEHLFGEASPAFSKPIVIHIKSKKFYSSIIWGGSIGVAESHFYNYWECDDLTQLIQLFIRNKEIADHLEKNLASILGYMRKFWEKFKKNTPAGSRKNIAKHYDLSNDFFELFLDKYWMMYSCAIFPDQNTTLEEASEYKLDVICKKLALKPTDKVLEIGTGWGGFALFAAQRYGCEIVTTTISQRQYERAKDQIIQKGLSSKVTLLNKDYRDLTGQYDKIVSIEMIEAVGHEYFNAFFKKCSDLLKPNGKMLLQSITIQDQAYEQAKNEVDFIKAYIFPGSCIPSITALINAMTNASDLRLFNLEDIGLHYAQTLRIWCQRMLINTPKIIALGFDDFFIKMWQFYFCYCEAGFAEGYLGDVQMVCVKPESIRENLRENY